MKKYIIRYEVDTLPAAAKDYPFSELILMTSRHKCGFRNGIYSRCCLETGDSCPYLKVKESEE